MSFLLCPDDILDIFVFLVPYTSVKKYVSEQKLIICSIYPSWLLRNVSRVIIIKKRFRQQVEELLHGLNLSEWVTK